MSFVWDSNILRHYLEDHPLLLENLTKVPRQHVVLPIMVVAKQLRGRADAILKAEPAQLARAQDLWQQTQALLRRFHLLYFDGQSLALVGRLKVEPASPCFDRGRTSEVSRHLHFQNTTYCRYRLRYSVPHIYSLLRGSRHCPWPWGTITPANAESLFPTLSCALMVMVSADRLRALQVVVKDPTCLDQI